MELQILFSAILHVEFYLCRKRFKLLSSILDSSVPFSEGLYKELSFSQCVGAVSVVSALYSNEIRSNWR